MNKPIYHFVPERNWINDPNGLCWFGGKYHLFYQHYPYAPKWGTMHWGHAVSDDLLHWEHLPIALFPTKAYDRDGVFSGSALIVENRLYLYYTAIRYTDTDEEDITVARPGDCFEASQALLISEDGLHFDNFKGKCLIIPPIGDPKLGHPVHTRDPKVWEQDGRYLMVLGSKIQEPGREDYTPRVLFYESKDALHWEYRNHVQLFGELGNMWECPDLFACPEPVLAISPEQMHKEAPTNNAVFGIIKFDASACSVDMDARAFRLIDYGLDYYAPQSFLDKDGNRVQIGWLRFEKPQANPDGTQWIGAMTLPRVVTTQDGQIFTRPHPGVQENFPLVAHATDGPFRMRKTLLPGDSLELGAYRLRFDGSAVTAQRGGRAYPAPAPGESADLEIYVDGCIIETYINNGAAVISHVL